MPDLRYCLLGGEALPISLANAWQAACPNAQLFNLYGPTEGTIAITGHAFNRADLDRDDRPTAPIGEVNVGSEGVLVGEDGQLAATGEPGELWIGGPQVVTGYLNKPEETERRFVRRSFPGMASRRWYRTGDLAESIPEGGYMFLGRIDDQVKIRGYRVELFEVEASLRAAADSQDVAAVPWPLTEGGGADGIVAFVVDPRRSDSEILALCSQRLPTYMVPVRVIAVDYLPMNPNGKLDRKALRAEHLEAGANPAVRPPSDPREVERGLIDGWSRLFPGHAVGPKTTFNSLNGDSLSYVNVLLQTEQLIGSMPAGWVRLTIAQLAAASEKDRSRITVRADMPALIRFVAILLVLYGHFGFISVSTGAVGAMMLLSGYFFGAVQLPGLNRGQSAAKLLWPLVPLCVIYYGVFIPVFWLATHRVSRDDLLMLQDISTTKSFLWYVHALVHIVLSVATMAWTVQVITRKSRRHLNVKLWVLSASLAFGAVAAFIMPLLAPEFDAVPGVPVGAWWHYEFVAQLFVFACGALLASPRRSKSMVLGLVATAGGAVLTGAFGYPAEGVSIALAGLALVFITNLRIPRVLTPVIYAIADASLFIYLMHIPLVIWLRSLGFNRSLRLALVLLICLVLAWAWNRVLKSPILRRLRENGFKLAHLWLRPPATFQA